MGEDALRALAPSLVNVICSPGAGLPTVSLCAGVMVMGSTGVDERIGDDVIRQIKNVVDEDDGACPGCSNACEQGDSDRQ